MKKTAINLNFRCLENYHVNLFGKGVFRGGGYTHLYVLHSSSGIVSEIDCVYGSRRLENTNVTVCVRHCPPHSLLSLNSISDQLSLFCVRNFNF